MEGIRKWLNEEETPLLTNADRFIAVLYILGIASREQIKTLTGWSDNQINEAIRMLRNRAEIPAGLKAEKVQLKMIEDGELEVTADKLERLKESVERKTKEWEDAKNAWVTIIRPRISDSAYYTLGEKAVKVACNMMFEPYHNWKVIPREQVAHFCGINEILCRFRRAGGNEADWMSAKEVERELYYYWNRHKRKGDQKRLPCRPDGYIKLEDGRSYFLEFDTGSERGLKLRDRHYNYLRLWNTVDSDELIAKAVIWVTTIPRRKKTIEEYAIIAMEHFARDHRLEDWPTVYVFTEGEETDFLLGKAEAKPIWGEELAEP